MLPPPIFLTWKKSSGLTRMPPLFYVTTGLLGWQATSCYHQTESLLQTQQVSTSTPHFLPAHFSFFLPRASLEVEPSEVLWIPLQRKSWIMHRHLLLSFKLSWWEIEKCCYWVPPSWLWRLRALGWATSQTHRRSTLQSPLTQQFPLRPSDTGSAPHGLSYV